MKKAFVLILLAISLTLVSCSDDKAASDKPNKVMTPEEKAAAEAGDVDKTPIKHLGVTLDKFDPATGMAGDFKFTKDTLYDEYLFANYGSISKNPGPNGEKEASPQIELLLPLGTKVHATVDGKIFDIKKLYSGDYSIQIDVGDPELYYELEHVINVTVKKGDKVKAGDVVAEVSTHNSKNNGGLGLFELGVLKHGNPPQHLCYFDHVDSKFKKELDKKISAFYKSWEIYKGDTSIYDEASMPTPGCNTRDAISDNNDYRVQS